MNGACMHVGIQACAGIAILGKLWHNANMSVGFNGRMYW